MLKNKYVKNSIILSIFLIVFLLFDLLLKHFLFHDAPSGVQWDFKILAGKSLLHKSTTFLDFIGVTLPFWVGQLISWSIVVMFLSMGFFTKIKYLPIFAGIILAGILGNTLDTVFNGGVRDIFFTPWMNRGVFNFADTIIVVGAMGLGATMIYNTFKKEA